MHAIQKRWLIGVAAATGMFAMAGTAQAGNILLTGHDILFHGGGDGYDGAILDFLRGAGTGSEIAKSAYSISIVGTKSTGSASFGDSGGSGNITGLANGAAIPLTGVLSGYSAAAFYDAATADWTAVLAADALVILSHTSCGGCSLTTTGSAAVNAESAAIATAFNAGLDIWGLAGATLGTFYDFLPPSAAVSGPPISGFNFTPTAAGAAIGITNVMTDGDATHNRFTGFSSAFKVFETRNPGDLSEVITIGVRDASIIDDDIIVDDDGTKVPEPGILSIFGIGLVGLGLVRRRRRKTA